MASRPLSTILDPTPKTFYLSRKAENAMARITTEDCLEKIGNSYLLVHVATARTRQLERGAEPRIQCKNRPIVTALREIAAGYLVATDASAPAPAGAQALSTLLH